MDIAGKRNKIFSPFCLPYLCILTMITLIIESYGMSLECHDSWCHLLTSFLVEKHVKILWKCHDSLMEFNRIVIEKGILVKCHENVMKFHCYSMGLKILVHFDGFLWKKSMESSWNLVSFSTKTPMRINDMAFYYEVMYFEWNRHHILTILMDFHSM